MSFDFVDYKKDFPLLMQQDVAYLDSAATAQRPASVLQAEKEFYEQANANPLRGLYELGVEATDRYEAARERVRKFLNAAAMPRSSLPATPPKASIWLLTAMR